MQAFWTILAVLALGFFALGGLGAIAAGAFILAIAVVTLVAGIIFAIYKTLVPARTRAVIDRIAPWFSGFALTAATFILIYRNDPSQSIWQILLGSIVFAVVLVASARYFFRPEKQAQEQTVTTIVVYEAAPVTQPDPHKFTPEEFKAWQITHPTI